MKRVTKIDENNEETIYGIHEVYYDENGTVKNWTKEPTSFIADTKDFRWHIEQLNVACKKPTLDYDTGKELVSAES